MKEKLTLTFTGDFTLSNVRKEKNNVLNRRIKNAPESFITGIKKIFLPDEYNILNLNTVLTESIPKNKNVKKEINSEASSKTIKILKELSISAVSHANNHSMNFGFEKLNEMTEILKDNNVNSFGIGKDLTEASRPFTILNNEKNIHIFSALRAPNKYKDEYGFLSTDAKPGILPLNPSKLNLEIKRLRYEEPDSVIIVYPYLHGELYEYKKVSENSNIKNWFEGFVDAGADFVIGHGTHIADKIVWYKDGLIVYSLGNFVSTIKSLNRENNAIPYSQIIKIHLLENSQFEIETHPIITDNSKTHYNTRFLNENEIENFKDNILSDLSVNEYELKNDGAYHFKVYKSNCSEDIFKPYIVPLMYNKFQKAGLLKDINYNYIKEVQDYWEKIYGKKVDTTMHVAFDNLYNIKDSRIVPGIIMRDMVIPYFNKIGKQNIYNDKNMYDKLIDAGSRVPKIYIKRVRSSYYDGNNRSVSKSEAKQILTEKELEAIIKPSTTNDGAGINKVIVKNKQLLLKDIIVTMESLEDKYGSDFMIQEVIQQHQIMATPHPSSVNTLRMVTLRWKGKIYNLLNFARFGSGGNINDNAGTGGVCVGINDDGTFLDYAIDEYPRIHFNHPTTNYRFSDMPQIPNFDEFQLFTQQLHKQIIHHDYVSWDIAVGVDGKPVFLEANFMGATWLYQLATKKSVFGNLTDEIITHITKENLKSDKPREIFPSTFN